MKKIALIVCVCVVLAASMVNADFPRRGRSCYSPSYSPCYEHVVTPYVAPTITTIIQEPIPTFIFQNLTGYPNLPASVTTPQNQYQAPPQATPPQIGLNDRDIEKIANVVVQKLQGGAMVQQTNMLMPPIVAEENNQQPLVMSQAIANEIGMKCASCHLAGQSVKGGLAIFNTNRQFQPEKHGQPYTEPQRLFERASNGEMPPNSATDVSKRLNQEALAFLRQWSGQ